MRDTLPDLDTRRRRIKFRAWHRGLREVDLLLGRFVDANMDTLDESDIVALEGLLDVQDQELLGWLMGFSPPDSQHDTPLWRRLLAFHDTVGVDP